MNDMANAEILKRFWMLLSEGDTDAASQLLDPSGVYWCRSVGQHPIDGLMKVLRSVSKVVPLRFVVHSEMEHGNWAMVELESFGTFPSSGETYNNRYIFLAEIRAGKIVEIREYTDTQYAMDKFTRNLPPEALESISALHSS